MYILNFGDKMHIEILLKQKRKEKKLTLEQLSKKTGVSSTHINDIENNLKSPSLLIMVLLYKVIW